jgi:hypothetical protein
VDREVRDFARFSEGVGQVGESIRECDVAIRQIEAPSMNEVITPDATSPANVVLQRVVVGSHGD